MKRHSLRELLKHRIPAMPRLLPIGLGTPLQFASSGGGGGSLDDPDDYYDDIPDAPDTGGGRQEEQRATAARRRTVQSEPDDRYWTDYLRIALPVIGLLLVIAVFWYWAQKLIDDNGSDVSGTEPAGIAEIVETATSEPTQESTPNDDGAAQGGEEAVPPTTTAGNNQQNTSLPSPTPSPEAEEPTQPDISDSQLEEALQGIAGGGGGEIAADMTVVVTEDGDGLSLRSDPTTAEDNIVTNLPAGTELEVVAGPEEADGFDWWQVVTPTGDTGWVVEGDGTVSYIESAG